MSIDNFKVRTITLHDAATNTVIKDAISIDGDGNVVFKDKNTEATVKNLVIAAEALTVSRSTFLTSGNEPAVGNTLFFTDNFQQSVSLATIYRILFEDKVTKSDFWFAKRASAFLDDSMDARIVEDFYKVRDLTSVNSEGNIVLGITVEENENWVNKWFDVPCVEVITPDYESNKSASMVAKVSYKVRARSNTFTAFRIYDATAGIELARNVHFVGKTNGFETHTVTVTYQGLMPKSEDDGQFCICPTITDFENINIINREEEGSKIKVNDSGYVMIPKTRHVIKVQWTTCENIADVNGLGELLTGYGRSFDPTGETSLDVTMFTHTVEPRDREEFGLLTGTVNLNDLERDQNNIRINFPHTVESIQDDYTIALGANKNIQAYVVEKDKEGFLLQWNRKPKDGIVDWQMIQPLREVEQPFDVFLDRDFAINILEPNVCFDIKLRSDTSVPPPPCPCPTDASFTLTAVPFGGQPNEPTQEELEALGCKCYKIAYEFTYTFGCGDNNQTITPELGTPQYFIECVHGEPQYNIQFTDTTDPSEGWWRSDSFNSAFQNTSNIFKCGDLMSFKFIDSNFPPEECAAVSVEVPCDEECVCINCECCEGDQIPEIYFRCKTDEDCECLEDEEREVYIVEDDFGNECKKCDERPHCFDAVLVFKQGDSIIEFGTPEYDAVVAQNKCTYELSELCPCEDETTDLKQIYDSSDLDPVIVMEAGPIFPDILRQEPEDAEDEEDAEEPLGEDEETGEFNEFVIIHPSLQDDQPDLRFAFSDRYLDENLLKAALEDLDKRNENQLERLENDRRKRPKELVAQLLADSEIRALPFDRPTYDIFFKNPTVGDKNKLQLQDEVSLRILQDDPFNIVKYTVTTSGFLGVKAFGHNVVVFDPNSILVKENAKRAIFPGFNPIGSAVTYNDVLEYIYTWEPPTEPRFIPPFPNFVVNTTDGLVVIDGRKYSPIFDYRNYRLLGSYDNDGVNVRESTFNAIQLATHFEHLVNGSLYVDANNNKYMIREDVYNQERIPTAIENGVTLFVKPSGLKFVRITDDVYDANVANGLTVVTYNILAS